LTPFFSRKGHAKKKNDSPPGESHGSGDTPLASSPQRVSGMGSLNKQFKETMGVEEENVTKGESHGA
jgi:hypothetical protein